MNKVTVKGYNPESDQYVFENIASWRVKLVRVVLNVALVVGAFALAGASYNAYANGDMQLIFFYAGGYALLAFTTLASRVPYAVRAGTILILLCGLGVLNLLSWGFSSDGRLFLIVFPFMAFLFFGRRGGFWGLVFSSALLFFSSLAFIQSPVLIPLEVQTSIPYLTSVTVVFLLLGSILLFSVDYLLRRFSEALQQSQELIGALGASREDAEREAARAQRQAQWLGHAADLARIMAHLHSRDELYQRVVRELAQRFDFYQVDLFAVDRQTGRLAIVAAYGAQGSQWVDRALQIAVGVDSLPGRAVQLGREEFSVDTAHLRYPESRAELAVPLAVRGDILGVLDIHTQQDAFEDEERRLLRILTDQIAASLDTLRLLEESEARSREMRSLYARSSAESWGLLLEEEQVSRYHLGTVPEEQIRLLALRAVETKQALVEPLDEERGDLLVVPLLARGMTLGFLGFTRTNGARWDEETIALAEDAAGRMATALDNTRLLLESRRRAFFEEQLGHLGDLVWSSSNSQSIMEQSVRELGRLLGAGEVTLYLAPPEVEAASAETSPLRANE